jgi:ribose transport system permease protein
VKHWRLYFKQNQGLLVAIGLFCFFYGAYSGQHPQGFTAALFNQNSNECFALVMAAMAQTIPVLTGGLDLSIGAILTLVNCLASELLGGTAVENAFGFAACLLAGLACGFCNGCLVVYGRLQPIIATLASSAIFIGIALFIRPTPGGTINGDLAFAMTYDLNEALMAVGLSGLSGPLAWCGQIPTTVFFALLMALIWTSFKRTQYGLEAYAIGASAEAAFMSGVQVKRAKLVAYSLAGFFAGVGGLYLALQTSSGNANIPQASAYTLNSIAAVVIGGTSLYGGMGGAIGSIFGALVLRSVAFNFRVIDEQSALGFLANPLYQPLVEGLVLLAAVSIGAFWVFRIKNRLEIFK